MLLASEQKIIAQALSILTKQLQEPGMAIVNTGSVKELLMLKLMTRKNEHFGVLFLNNQHEVLAYEELFHGTVNASSVHPRVVVQRALAHNAAAVIFAHNHPSGICEPSVSDHDITNVLVKAMGLVDVRVLDHMIVARDRVCSFADRGFII